jgi:hypothetical protein
MKTNNKNAPKNIVLYAAGFNLQVTPMPIEWLTSSPEYPKRWDARAVARIKKEIETMGVIPPILVSPCSDRNACAYTVLAGWLRVQAAAELGYRVVPVIDIDIDNAAHRARLRDALDRDPIDWDHDIVAGFMRIILEYTFITSDANWLSYLARFDEWGKRRSIKKVKIARRK